MARKSPLEHEVDLGRLPDRVIADRHGCTAENVRAFRMRRSIPAGWRTSKTEKPEPKPEPVRSIEVDMPPVPLNAYRVTFDDNEQQAIRIATGNTIAEAAVQACRAEHTGLGWPVKIELVGAMLSGPE